jgi:FKBP-type peptidyl-prolyl cis-trans isomerase
MRYCIAIQVKLILLVTFSLALNSCNKTLQEEKGYAEDRNIESFIKQKSWTYSKVDGIYHVTRVPSYGYHVELGDSISFLFKGYTIAKKDTFDTNIRSVAISSKLDTNTHSFDPIVAIAGQTNLVKGVKFGLLQLWEGEDATLLFPSTLGFGNNAIGPVGQWSSLAYDIKLLSVSNTFIRQEKEYINSLSLEGSGYSKDISGLYYKYIILGAGSFPTLQDSIYGWYEGTLPDGTIIKDLRNNVQPIVLSENDLPIGVRLGFALTKVGGSTNLTIPSFLGYGNVGQNSVKPYQTVFYKIRLDSIK